MRLWRILLLCLGLGWPILLQATLLEPADAFRPSLARLDKRTLEARFNIAPGYYLYRERFSFDASGVRLTPNFPPGQLKNDPAFGQVETYPQSMAIRLLSDQDLANDASVTLKYQGCSDEGVCYPPQSAILRPGESTPTSRSAGLQAIFGVTASPVEQPLLLAPRSALFAGSLPATLGLFFLAGLGLAFTSCMYPLLPIVSGIVLQDARHGRRAIGLTLMYVQGMALTYTLAGLLAAASGAFLVVTLQQPWVIAGFSLFFIVMALAMFGVFSLQLPSQLQSRLNDWANRLPGGRFASVFLMGAISALIIGPCVAPPLAAALAYLGQTGDLLLGGAALYMLALGLGGPLLLVGMLGATALPRLSLQVLHLVRLMFGIALLGMAIWVARPLWQTRSEVSDLNFHNVASASELDEALRLAKGRPVLLDFYADWCLSCLDFERETLADPTIRSRLQAFSLLRADITANTPEHHRLLQRFHLYGPPAILFFDAEGLQRDERVIGTMNADAFGAVLGRVQ